jgi:hypothetical protein
MILIKKEKGLEIARRLYLRAGSSPALSSILFY